MKKLSILFTALVVGVCSISAWAYESARPENAKVLTSKTGGTVNSSSGSFNSGPADAFANDGSSRMLKNAKAFNIMYTFTQGQTVNGYGIKAGGSYFEAARGPKEWKIYGSNDYVPGKHNTTGNTEADQAATWTEIDYQKEQTGWVSGEYRYYSFANAEPYTTYKIEIIANNGNGYTQWQYMEYCFTSLCTLMVAGVPEELGEVSPKFGVMDMPTTATTFTSYENFTNQEDTIALSCVGYKIYQKDGDDVWQEVDADTKLSFTMDPMPTVTTKVEWQYDADYLVSVENSEFGSVAGTGWYARGAEVQLAAIPVEGYRFVAWSGDVPNGHEMDNPLVLTADSPKKLMPLFMPTQAESLVLYVSTTGNDENSGFSKDAAKKTISAAIAFIERFEGFSGTVVVLPGKYDISKPIAINGPINVIGESGRPTDATVHNTKSSGWEDQNHRVFEMRNAAASISNLTISNGRTEQKEGSCVYMENGGVVSNCVITGGYGANYYGYGAGFYNKGGLVTHCIISNCSHATSQSWGMAGVLVEGTGARAENCLFIDCNKTDTSDVVLKVEKKCTAVNCSVLNCKLGGNDSAAIWVGWTDAKSTICYAKNCLVFGCASTNNVPCPFNVTSYPDCAGMQYLNCAAEVEIVGATDCVVIDSSAFKNYAAGDYRPAAGGVLIDKGVTPEGWEKITDLAGGPRVVGKAIDIGCYEGKAAGMLLIVR